MRYILLVLLLACNTAEDRAMSRFANSEAWCTNATANGVALCSLKTKNYVCFTTPSTAFCIEAIDPLYLDAQ